jgi:hypothetical protein
VTPGEHCLGTTAAGARCRTWAPLGALFCHHHQRQGLPCFGGPGDGVRVLVVNVEDLPFTVLPRPNGGLAFERVGPGHPAPAGIAGRYVLAAHPLTGRPCARWQQLVHPPRAQQQRESERGQA